tara:strand:+ start:212 stop:622 length:411 start_codon:yes stop_codon:yes gene_type:complete
MLKYYTIFILLFLYSCDKNYTSSNSLVGSKYYDPKTGTYVYLKDKDTLFYSNYPKSIEQFLNNPEKGYQVKYNLNINGRFKLFHIDQPVNTAVQLKLSKEKNRLSMYLGAPGDGLSYLLIKHDPEDKRLTELHNVY